MMTIGEFSRICFVTKKTLRHYDEIGLLRPEHTAENGYRYYTVGQLRTMLLINRLKSYGFSLPEVSAALACPDEALLAEKLAEKRRQMEQGMENTARLLRQMEADMDKLNRRIDIMEQNIIVKQVELQPQTIFGLRKRIDIKDFPAFFGELFAAIGQNKLPPAGPPLAFYHEAEFNPQNTDIELAVPVAEGTPGSRVLAGGPHAMATLLGAYDTDAFTAAYSALMEWVEQNGYRLAGAPYDKYVRGGDDCKPEEYITEIYFPLMK